MRQVVASYSRLKEEVRWKAYNYSLKEALEISEIKRMGSFMWANNGQKFRKNCGSLTLAQIIFVAGANQTQTDDISYH